VAHPALESTAPARDEAAAREERVLASVIQRHHQTSDLPGWLPADVFTGAARQEVFTAIVSLHIRGEPIDDLTTDWERARLQATASGTTGPDTSYAQRLARMPVGPAEALGACRALLSDHGKPADKPRGQAQPESVIGGPSRPTAPKPDTAPCRPPLLQPPGPSGPAGPEPRMR